MEEIPEDLHRKMLEYNENYERLTKMLDDSATPLEDSVAADLQVEKSKQMLDAATPLAIRTLLDLTANAVSESVRFKAAVWIAERRLGKNSDMETENEALSLLKRIHKEGGE